jgi:hypothetical protein
MAEASSVIIDLMHGTRLPHPTLDSSLVVVNDNGSMLQVG